jgi:NADH-quinone oxidoreductase subunit J
LQLALEVGQTAKPEAVMFWILGPLAVVSSLAMLLVKKAVHSAILMAFVMVILAVFYIAQDAAFLGIVQVVVYTGAVMMLFLFILMLVGVDSSDSLTETIRGLRPIAITAAIGFGGLMVSLLGRATIGRNAIGLSAANADGNVQGIAALLFSTYVFAFEVVSALLITAAMGAMVLAHHQRTTVRPTQVFMPDTMQLMFQHCFQMAHQRQLRSTQLFLHAEICWITRNLISVKSTPRLRRRSNGCLQLPIHISTPLYDRSSRCSSSP